MLVLDLADDLLDQILDRHQPVDAAELVDHHRDMGARLTHLHQQVEDRQGRRDEQHLAQQRRQLGLAAFGDRGQDILDVDEADHVVERFAIDRDARMALLDHAFDDLGERRLDIERHDVDARHHDVGGGAVVALEDVADQHPLMRAERIGTVGRRLFDHLVDGLAQAFAVALPADQPQQAAQTAQKPDPRSGWPLLSGGSESVIEKLGSASTAHIVPR